MQTSLDEGKQFVASTPSLEKWLKTLSEQRENGNRRNLGTSEKEVTKWIKK